MKMTYRVSWCVRIKEDAELSAMKERGLWLTLSYWPPSDDGQTRTYQLAADVEEDILELGQENELLSISEFIKGVLVKRDGGKWYVPSEDELRKDLMIDENLT